MTNNEVSGNGKREKRSAFFPLIALVAGLCIPLYAYADGAQCTNCHNTCEAIRTSVYYACLASYPDPASPAFNGCYSPAVAAAGQCHYQCQIGICSQH